jgi:hypothetical protein
METSPYKPFNIRTRDRLVGIFVIAGILLFLLGFLLPKLTELRQQELLFHTLLDETYGIVPGAKVSMRGLEIGQVEAVKLEANRIRIDFSLQSKYADFYRIGSVLNLNTNLAVSTLLTGTGLILIPGKGDLLNAGAAIPAQPPPELADVMDKLSDPAAECLRHAQQHQADHRKHGGTLRPVAGPDRLSPGQPERSGEHAGGPGAADHRHRLQFSTGPAQHRHHDGKGDRYPDRDTTAGELQCRGDAAAAAIYRHDR